MLSLFLFLFAVVFAAGVTAFVFYSIYSDKITDLNLQVSSLEDKNKAWDKRWQQVVERYRPIVNLDEEANKIRAEIIRLHQELIAYESRYQEEHDKFIAYSSQLTNQRVLLEGEYQQSKSVYDRLRSEIRLLEENLEDISFGLYKPHFDFIASEVYKQELERAREAKKEMVRSNQAIYFKVEWTVGGSRAEGERMQKQLAKLMLRAFNGECDAAIANCTWNNITRMIERVKRAYNAINQLGTVVQVEISQKYVELSLHELQLDFEHKEKKRAEMEEQRAIRERMREEEREQRELQRAEAETRADERRYELALEKARNEYSKAQGQRMELLADKIKELEKQLIEAHAMHERAISMAQQTKQGYVYVISNIGSFGPNVFKIGLTRRLEPMERVRELGDASVPFTFDVHAFIFCEDAPALEAELHRKFRAKSVNLINDRKEFFAVTLEEIEHEVRKMGHHIEFTKIAEAREFRETLAMKQKQSESKPVIPPASELFPESLKA